MQLSSLASLRLCLVGLFGCYVACSGSGSVLSDGGIHSSSGGTTDASGGDASGSSSGSSGSGDSGSDGGRTPDASPAESGGPIHWVGTWTASPYYDSSNQPPASLTNSVLRQVAHVSLGGSPIRVRFSNVGGDGPVTINAAHVALCKSAPAVDSTIDTTTDQALAFSGTASVTITPGTEVWSDPINFTVPNQGNVTITTAFGSAPTAVSGHSGSRTTSYLQSGSSYVSEASMTSPTAVFQHWYYISGIDVGAAPSAVGVVAIGDSITDGRGSDTDLNDRWTDVMAARLQANASTANVATMNQGIGATNLIGTGGTAAQARFARDVLGQSGVRYAIVLDGVNDINGGASAASMEAAYADMISRAHAKGVLIYGGTITPFGGSSYYSLANEAVRQQVNAYIRASAFDGGGSAFDGVIDFDAALTDGGSPPKLQAAYATWAQMDWLHPGPAGYQKMGNTVDLTLFTK
jgi:lysophospholipase L1-like esterase